MSVFPQSALLSAITEKFYIVERTRVSDNAGGSIVTYTDGMEFEAAIALDNSTQARIGEVQGLTEVYTLLIPMTLSLEYHDIIKRKSDNKTFRITSDSDEVKTPSISAMSMRSVSAEEWELTR